MEYVGTFGVGLSCLSFFPQTIKIIKTKNTISFSLIFLIMRFIGISAVFIYSYYTKTPKLAILAAFISINIGIYLVYKIVNIVREGESIHTSKSAINNS